MENGILDFKKFQLDGKVVRDACLFVSNDERRPYITGINVDVEGLVVSTDGHSLYKCQSNINNVPQGFESAILKFHGKIPQRCDVVHITTFAGEGFAVAMYDGNEKKRVPVTVIGAKFPDWKQVFPSADTPKKLTDTLNFGTGLLKRLDGVFDYAVAVHYSDQNSPVLFTETGSPKEWTPQVVLMPVRID